MTSTNPIIAVLGGTGEEGFGLALRWSESGYRVIIGSRSLDKALSRASEANSRLSRGSVSVEAMDNLAAARTCDISVLTVPYKAHEATLTAVKEALQGKILVDVTVPLVPPRVSHVHLPLGGSAGQEAQAILGENVRVVTAFQNISATHLRNTNHPIECDVLVCGDDESACEHVIRMAEAAGMSGWNAGPLANAVALESLTPVLIAINQRYKTNNAGICITGIRRD